jgi:hypothetical protein
MIDRPVWLLATLPDWFFFELHDPYNGGALKLVPALGMFGLSVGALFAILRPRWVLLAYLLPLLGSEALVYVAGVLGPRLAVRWVDPALIGFLVVEAMWCGLAIRWSRGTRLAAGGFTLFCLCFALFATLLAARAFTNNWG